MYNINNLKLVCTKKESCIINEAVEQFNLYKDIPNTVVDIGAHIGTISLLAAKRGARYILAFEPIFKNFNRLVRNIRLNKFYTSITPIKMAVTSQIGLATLYSKKGLNSGQISTMYKQKKFDVIDVVPSLTLSTILQFINTIDYLKIDVEGGEFDILLNTPKNDMYNVEYIDLEIHDPNNLNYFENNDYSIDQLQDFISECGFDSKNSFIRIK